MIKKSRVPFGVWIMAVAWGISFCPLWLSRIGGTWTILGMLLVGLVGLVLKNKGASFEFAIREGLIRNGGMMILLGLYYLMVIVSALRYGFNWNEDSFILKLHVVNIIALFFGFFLIKNPRYFRICIYVSALFMLFQATLLRRFVDVTGEGARLGLIEAGGVLGHTSNWEGFAMQTLLLLGILLEEKNKVVKIIGFLILPLFYRGILLCGFATPVALFLLGHGVLGILFLLFAKPTKLALLLKVAIPCIFITAMILTVTWIRTMPPDSRYRDIQYRFDNFINDPLWGGYERDDRTQSRLFLGLVSWESFKRSPVFGTGGVYPSSRVLEYGGHQAVVDYLAVFGIAGGGPFILFVLLCLSNSIRRYRKEQTWVSAASIAVVVIFIGGGCVNPCWYGFPMTVMLLYAQPFKISYFRVFRDGAMVMKRQQMKLAMGSYING